MKKSDIIAIIVSLLVGGAYYYVVLPPINLSAVSFYVWIGFVLGVYLFYNYCAVVFYKTNRNDSLSAKYFKKMIVIIVVFVVAIASISINSIVFGPIFQSENYHNWIQVEDSDFIGDVEQADFTNLPLVDKASTEKLGDRVLGQLPELISQFSVSNEYTQVNYNESIVRVTPLEYEGFIRYLNNRSEGAPGYIVVDSTSGEADLIQLEEGMKYMPSAYFQEDLIRHARFQYPFDVFGDVNFEVDDEGNPFWVIQTLEFTAIGMRREVDGVIVVDPITGEIQKYSTKDVPAWVDNVWDADLIMEQLNNWGLYGDGYINSILGQQGVKRTTEGYNYLTINDDVYVYTGITSVLADESNIGFVLVNLRTKEANFYPVPGAEEYSAMDSAMGLVQEKGYNATFPLLINLNDKPTYMMSLKDDAGLVKMYAFVDVENYQKVTVSDSSLGIDHAVEVYLGEDYSEVNLNDAKEENLVISSLRYLNVEGTSYAYFIDRNVIYRISLDVSSQVAFLVDGQVLDVTYVQQEDYREVVELH